MDTGDHRTLSADGSAATGGGLGLSPSPCWSCRGPLGGVTALFCSTCNAVQPAGQADHFSRLDLPACFAIDAGLLDRRYFERQRLLHPDRFVTRSGRERALSQSQATALNEAYETLKDPLRRADYLLHLGRDRSAPEGCSLVNDQELLQEALELREALAEADSTASVCGLATQCRDDIASCERALTDAFAADDREGAARLATRLKYLRKLADDCRTRRLQVASQVVTQDSGGS